MAADGDRFPREERLQGLFDLFERLRERPAWRWRARLRPVLLLLGPDEWTGRVAETFEKRCKDERAPVSHIAGDLTSEGGDGDAGADVADVLREAKRELSQPTSHGRGEPALRFPLLDMALWLYDLRRIRLRDDEPAEDATAAVREDHRLVQTVTQPPAVHSENERRRELRRVIKRRGRHVLRDVDETPRGRTATFLAFLEQIAPIGVAVVALVSAGTAAALDLFAAVLAAAIGFAFVAVQVIARARGWYGTLRYRWFMRQPYLRDDAPDFLSFGLGVFAPHNLGDEALAAHAEGLDRLLVAAFLEDLRRNYRRDHRRAAWARVRYPVVLFEHLTAAHPGARFVELVERVRSGRDVPVGAAEPGRPPGFDPLVIVAGVDPAALADPAPCADPSAPAGPRLADRLAGAVQVDLGPGGPRTLAEAYGLWRRYRRAQRRIHALGAERLLCVDLTRDRRDRALPQPEPPRRRPLVAHPALPWVATVLVAAASTTVIALQASWYCSGFDIRRMADGQCIGITDGSFRFGESSSGTNNDNRLNDVLAAIEDQNEFVVRSDDDYVTIVYLGPITADPDIDEPRVGLLAGVQGELVGLLVAQEEANQTSSGVGLRVLIANAGAEFEHAAVAVEQIRERAAVDETIVAVVGFEQSRRQTQKAIRTLSKSSLPMIGTASSYSKMGTLENGEYSRYYFRLAPMNSRLADHAAYWARNGHLGGKPVEDAVVIYNGSEGDLYSTELAQDFREEFGPGRTTMYAYGEHGGIGEAVQQECGADPPDLFYYAGRSTEFRSFVNALKNWCPPRPLVLADDEIARYVTDNGREIGGRRSIDLYFMPMAAREAWTERWLGSDFVHAFYWDYYKAVDELVEADEGAPSAVRAAVAYDAAKVIAVVADDVHHDQQRAQPTKSSVFAALSDSTRNVLPNGASGVLRFGERAEGHPVPDKPVLLATVRPDGTTEVLQVCGKLSTKGQADADCPPDESREDR